MGVSDGSGISGGCGSGKHCGWQAGAGGQEAGVATAADGTSSAGGAGGTIVRDASSVCSEGGAGTVARCVDLAVCASGGTGVGSCNTYSRGATGGRGATSSRGTTGGRKGDVRLAARDTTGSLGRVRLAVAHERATGACWGLGRGATGLGWGKTGRGWGVTGLRWGAMALSRAIDEGAEGALQGPLTGHSPGALVNTRGGGLGAG
ncbi:unnamed protein product [Closterium sp. Naga37s-1]|nr:unnamed protein product [Closterium sp. Naga37s-1]CAI5509185.1 unnamed protein product [Closterium sp. Naga37s-1]